MSRLAILLLSLAATSAIAGEVERTTRDPSAVTGVGACTRCHLQLGQPAIRRVEYLTPADAPARVVSPQTLRETAEMMMQRASRGDCTRPASVLRRRPPYPN